MTEIEDIMYECKDCGWYGGWQNAEGICPNCDDGELEEYEPDLPECRDGEIVKHCESCGAEVFDGDEFELCHICKDAYVCEHCQSEAVSGGHSDGSFCSESCHHTWRERVIRKKHLLDKAEDIKLCYQKILFDDPDNFAYQISMKTIEKHIRELSSTKNRNKK